MNRRNVAAMLVDTAGEIAITAYELPAVRQQGPKYWPW